MKTKRYTLFNNDSTRKYVFVILDSITIRQHDRSNDKLFWKPQSKSITVPLDEARYIYKDLKTKGFK